MWVYVLVGYDGYVYGVFDDEEKAYDYGEDELPGVAWEVFEREVK